MTPACLVYQSVSTLTIRCVCTGLWSPSSSSSRRKAVNEYAIVFFKILLGIIQQLTGSALSLAVFTFTFIMKEQRRDSKPRVLIVLKQNEYRAGRAGELGLLALRWNRLLPIS